MRKKTTDFVEIYPNPFQKNLLIKFPSEIESGSLKLFDVLGKELLNQNITGTSTSIDKDLAKGLYIVELNIKNQVSFYKILKN